MLPTNTHTPVIRENECVIERAIFHVFGGSIDFLVIIVYKDCSQLS